MTETEMKQFEATRIGKVGWIQRNFESKILAALQVAISGEQFGEEALRQAQLMESKVRQFRSTPT